MKSLVWGSCLALVTMLAACSKDPPPKPTKDEGSKATPVPSDVVFNDFMPSGGGAVGLRVDGGGLEAGLAAVGGDGAGAAGGEAPAPAAAEDPARALKLLEPGAEPRAVRKYAFVANKSEKRQLTMKQSASREGGGGGPAQEATFSLLVELTPKVVTPKGTKFEMKVLKVEIPGIPPAQKAQAEAQLAVFSGLTGRFDVTPSGDIGEVDFKADDKLQNGAAEMIVNSLSQAVELVVPPFPSEPIGVGAKWERSSERKERGVEQSQKHTFTLTEFGENAGVVTADIDLKVPKRPLQARGVPPGATQEVSAKGVYTYNFKLDRVATKVDGELTAKAKIEIPDGKGGKQAVTEISKLKNSMEAPK
ncbi:MAG: hypothetical protein KF819_15575 [Labilithrix sp.]|nr:hypothetical protein [Labilithrix sp.]